MASSETPAESEYYRNSGAVPLASRISLRARRQMFRLFMDHMKPNPRMRVLDVGVTSDQTYQESNYFEQMYPYPHNITCVGTEDGSHLATRYPGLTYTPIRPGERLPFAAGEFDIVFSNAVLEHVGSREAQRAFLQELRRVGKAFFVTTPNRWFPVEHHTGLPLVHYLPPATFRALLRHTRYQFWSHESNLNILTSRELLRLFPLGAAVQVRSVHLFGLPTNLVAWGKGDA
jgi:hypothetical protein